MRLVFGVMSLLVVLAIVGTLGKKQFEALGLSGQNAARVATPPGAAAAPVEGTVPQQAKAIQNNVRDAAAAALQQGADRAAQQANQ
jgi:apolipoprotein N-acyltransferase